MDGEQIVLNGVKSMVPLASSAELLLVYASEEGVTQAFLVPREADGLTIVDREQLMGINGSAAVSRGAGELPHTGRWPPGRR